VVNDGRVVKSLNSHEFTHYKLKTGESFDFGDFANAREFFDNAKPIIPMINQLKHDIATGNHVVMVTARADFNDRELFLDTFRKYGVNMNKVHVYRAGNMTGKIQTEEKKKIIIRDLLSKGHYTKAIMYDDAVPNLESFVELKDEYPHTKFYAWHVSLEGEASEYHRTNESIGDHDTDDSSITLDPDRGDYEIRNYHKLDKYLAELCDLVERGQQSEKDYGMVGAGILTLTKPYMARLNRPGKDGRVHAEHAVIEDFKKKYGEVPEGTVIITTLSPCNKHMDERDGPACADIINANGIEKVYCGYLDPTQKTGEKDHRHYNLIETANSELRTRCQKFADTFLDEVNEGLMGLLPRSAAKTVAKKPTSSLADIRAASQQTQDLLPPPHIRMYLHRIKDAKEKGIAPQFSASEYRELEQWVAQQKIHSNLPENFADGKGPGRPGDSQRHGIKKHSTMAELEKASHAGGRKGQLARWQLNMRRGHKK
jgi:pyrimidine deaminase RibD-like protein